MSKELLEERDRLRSILDASKVALGPGVTVPDEGVPKCIEGLAARRAGDAARIQALERALARIRDRAVGKLPDMESPPDNRLLTIYVLAVAALDDLAEPPATDASRR